MGRRVEFEGHRHRRILVADSYIHTNGVRVQVDAVPDGVIRTGTAPGLLSLSNAEARQVRDALTAVLGGASIGDLLAAGDALQSAASRIAEWGRRVRAAGGDVPYEVSMALHEAESAVAEWTAARTR